MYPFGAMNVAKGSRGRHVLEQHKDDGRRPSLFCAEHNVTFELGIPCEAHLSLYHAEKGWREDLRP